VLADAIKTANFKHANWLHSKEVAERQAVHRKQQADRKAAKDADDKAIWAQRKKEDAEDRASINKKLAGPIAGRKFTLRERSYWTRTYGPGTRLLRGA
jgi:hypothetical protein